jgi:hypothetical protein
MRGGGGVKFNEYLKKVNKIFTDNIDEDIFKNIKDNIEQTDESLINQQYLRTIISINNVNVSRGGGHLGRQSAINHLRDNESPDFIQLLVIIVLFSFLVDIFSGKNKEIHGGAVFGRYLPRKTSMIITALMCICMVLLCWYICINQGFLSDEIALELAKPLATVCFKTLMYNERLQSDLHNLESAFRTDREFIP